jgi:hypothetical protein
MIVLTTLGYRFTPVLEPLGRLRLPRALKLKNSRSCSAPDSDIELKNTDPSAFCTSQVKFLAIEVCEITGRILRFTMLTPPWLLELKASLGPVKARMPSLFSLFACL